LKIIVINLFRFFKKKSRKNISSPIVKAPCRPSKPVPMIDAETKVNLFMARTETTASQLFAAILDSNIDGVIKLLEEKKDMMPFVINRVNDKGSSFNLFTSFHLVSKY
jgi:hypothetical protein